MDFDKNGKKFINFKGEIIEFSEFADIYEFVNFEVNRCGLDISTNDFFTAFESIKKNCEK